MILGVRRKTVLLRSLPDFRPQILYPKDASGPSPTL